jgi:CubicO group peptidase (beta-lactamase class C family)
MASFDSERFDDIAFSKLSETKLPSVAVSIIENGEVVHTRGFGYKDVSAALPPTEHTLYGVGSITKSFVALSIAKLVEAGKMDFHDPVTKFLPLKQKAFRGVEIHHLLSHTSGIPGLGSLEVLLFSAFGEYHHWLPISSLGDMQSFLSDIDDWAEAKPGEKLFYLNEGFVLLGDVVAKVSGRPWFDYAKEEILKPLRMNRTFLEKADINVDADVATPYLIRGPKVTPTVVPYGSGGAGGVMSNAMDLSNYVKMYINGGEFEGKRIIGKDTLTKMETPYGKWPAEHYGGDSYGYGLQILPNFHGHKVVGHGGSVDCYTAQMNYIRDLRSGVVLLANGAGYNMGRLAMIAQSLLTGADPGELRAVRLETLLKKLEGQYKAYKDTIFAEVKINGSFLMLSGEDIGKDIVLVPEGEEDGVARFYTLDAGAKMEVTFRFNKYGVELLYERYRYRRSGPLPQQPGV